MSDVWRSEHQALPVEAPPSHTDPTVARAAAGIGGRWGRYAGVGTSGWWTPVRVLLAFTCLTLLLGFAQKAPCADGNWSGSIQYTRFCYSDVVPLWSAERLDVGAVPYRDTAVEYPVATGAFMWITAEFTRGVHALNSDWNQTLIFTVLTSILLAACALVVTVATAQTSGRRPYYAALFALSPLLVFHAFTNWDLLAMAFTSAALWAWAREKPVLAGALIGLGTAAKLYPVFLFVALFVLAYRTRRWGPTLWAAATAAVTWLALNLPFALAYRDGWWEFYAFSRDRAAERSSAWAVIKTAFATGLNVQDAVYWVPPGWAVALMLVAAVLLVVYVGLYAPARPRLGQLAFLAVLAFLLTTKVWSPQYSLWMVPLLALARPRWRLALIWQFAEIGVWLLTLTLLHGEEANQAAHGVTYGWLVLMLVIRGGLLLALAVLVVREMWHPELDLVRSGGVDDPAGGDFEGAPEPPPRYAEPLPA